MLSPRRARASNQRDRLGAGLALNERSDGYSLARRARRCTGGYIEGRNGTQHELVEVGNGKRRVSVIRCVEQPHLDEFGAGGAVLG